MGGTGIVNAVLVEYSARAYLFLLIYVYAQPTKHMSRGCAAGLKGGDLAAPRAPGG